MKRVIKRFLLYNAKDNNDLQEKNFEELKQDLQMMRYEINNDIKRMRTDAYKQSSLLHIGLGIMGEELLKNSNNRVKHRFRSYKHLIKSSDTENMLPMPLDQNSESDSEKSFSAESEEVFNNSFIKKNSIDASNETEFYLNKSEHESTNKKRKSKWTVIKSALKKINENDS